MKGHHGYRLSALISTLPNAAWGKLAAEFLVAKRSPETLKVFVNTVLGEPWRDNSEGVEEGDLMSRVEPVCLDRIPADVISLTAGLDVQGDRIEMTSVGWTEDDSAVVLSHEIAWGDPLDPATWVEVDDLLRRRFAHPLGGKIGYDAAMINSGDGGTTDAVYAFCRPRIGQRVFPLKGIAGFGRQAVTLSVQKSGIRLQVAAVDVIKTQIMARFQGKGGCFRHAARGMVHSGNRRADRGQVFARAPGEAFPADQRTAGRRYRLPLLRLRGKTPVVRIDPNRRRDELAAFPVARKAPTVSRSK